MTQTEQIVLTRIHQLSQLENSKNFEITLRKLTESIPLTVEEVDTALNNLEPNYLYQFPTDKTPDTRFRITVR